ncbi:microcin ABC transporter ATP-binding protein [Psychromonas sp. B3M02]|uniref:ABC transporter ATP-binding protein n=1 Tax=Psychromonas sp. B3M02 TaxID=2267226 RepID=UPI000DE92A03|nr:dipeptide ABC transporter ATP-binding protein [Psychromonas sp. B3M02]RBW47804.1 microcin ABC transporter ATP-binding protein [Psychromonas sp. B3M02]
MSEQAPLLSVDNLAVSFAEQSILSGVSFTLEQGKTLAIVGESGSGKSLTALSILQLLPYPHAHHPAGKIHFQGRPLLGEPEQVLEAIRGNKISMIFQEPMTSLNPLHSIEKQIGETLLLHKGLTGKKAQLRSIELLKLVGIETPEERLNSYPHQLSGGQRQRVMIAMALANEPNLLIADEPTTALDATIQKQILALLKTLQKKLNMGILLITHDLNIVRQFADDVLVMCKGQQVEYQKTVQVFTAPQHEYTKTLLNAVPEGEMPELVDPKVMLSAYKVNVSFPTKKNFWGKVIKSAQVVKDVSLTIHAGETLAIVGESGSGKSTLAQALLQLNKHTGQVVYLGETIGQLPKNELQLLRQQLQIVFQDPYASLSPRMSVRDIVAEGLQVFNQHNKLSEQAVEQQVQKVLLKVGLDSKAANRYPHQFSGGQRQRIAIARALVLKPKLIVLDEPTSALDRSIQKQIIELLKNLQQELGLSYLFISHDLSVVRAISHRVLVLKSGEVVEQGTTSEIFENAKHSYTQELLSSVVL